MPTSGTSAASAGPGPGELSTLSPLAENAWVHTQLHNALRREETGNDLAAIQQKEIHKLRQELDLERRDLFDAGGSAGAGSTGKRKQPSPQPDVAKEHTAARHGGQRTGRVIVAVIVECVPARASTNTDVHPYCIPHPAVDLILSISGRRCQWPVHAH